jgi:hypothetical protein
MEHVVSTSELESCQNVVSEIRYHIFSSLNSTSAFLRTLLTTENFHIYVSLRIWLRIGTGDGHFANAVTNLRVL